ncbi:MAG: hypothetical protein RMJ44_04990 [Cytophagales bacterium]|nr:hypothetical protein [Cytophagales bacterium]
MTSKDQEKIGIHNESQSAEGNALQSSNQVSKVTGATGNAVVSAVVGVLTNNPLVIKNATGAQQRNFILHFPKKILAATLLGCFSRHEQGRLFTKIRTTAKVAKSNPWCIRG